MRGLNELFPNPVTALLGIGMLSGSSFLSFVTEAPNRLSSGEGMAIWLVARPPFVAGYFALMIAAIVFSFFRSGGWVHFVTAACCIALIVSSLFLAGNAAAGLSLAHSPASRTGLGSGFWLILFSAALGLVDALQRLGAKGGIRIAIWAAIAGIIVSMAAMGVGHDLSLAREFQARQGVFTREFGRHLLLVALALLPASAIGFPLGILAYRRPGIGRWLLTVLGLIQTIPSVAFFGLLILPLSAIGLSGVGTTPVVLALIAYALLPVVRTTSSALASIQPEIRESALGMGFDRSRLFRAVELPLALPILLGGLRYVVVQTIGLAVIAALIGAGGLGTFVFQGIAQYATDLVLLGALAVIFLALAADALLQLLRGMLMRSAS